MKLRKISVAGRGIIGQVLIVHGTTTQVRQRFDLNHAAAGFLQEIRTTRILLVLPNGTGSIVVEATADCSPLDTFEKAKGRKIAANKLMAELRREVPEMKKEERQHIFDAICPEFRRKGKIITVGPKIGPKNGADTPPPRGTSLTPISPPPIPAPEDQVVG